MTERGESPRPVAAKLARPQTDNVSLRADTAEVFRRELARRVTLVCAPAGYGKTTVTASACESLGLATAWYRLDILDHDPFLFLASLTEAVRAALPGFGEIVLERVRSAKDAPLSVEELAALFVAECGDHVTSELHFVLDDYQEAADSAGLNRTLDYLVRNLPANIRVVVLTRYDPAFSTGQERLADQVGLLGVDQLRFDARQAAEVLAGRFGHRPDDHYVERLVELTEGWPAAIVLAGLTFDWLGVGSIKAALEDPRLRQDVYTYLAEQVYRREDAATQHFLKRTCCLEHVTEELANRLVGAGDAHRRLNHLAANRAFTFPAGGRGTYRYHNLFREFLRHRFVQDEGAAAFQALHVETAAALEDAGETEMAVELLIGVNEPLAALDVIARAGEPGLDSIRSDAVASWLQRLHEHAGHNHPWAMLLRSHMDMRIGNYDAAISHAKQAAARFRAMDDASGLYHALCAKECAEFWKGDVQSAAATCRLAIRHAPTDENRAHVLISLGSAFLEQRDWEAADAAYAEAEGLVDQTSRTETIRVRTLRALCTYHQGDILSARQQVAADANSLPAGGLLASVQNTVGIIETALAQHAGAQEALRAAIDIARTHGLSHLRGIIADNLGMSLAASGCADAAMQSINEAVECDAVRADPSTLALGLCHTATVHRRLGYESEARKYYRQALDALGERDDAYVALNCAANLALVEGRSRRRDDGELERIAASAKRAGVLFVAHKAILFQAVLLNRAGERHAATQALARCLPHQLSLGHFNLIGQEFALDPTLLLAASRLDVQTMLRQVLQLVCCVPNGAHRIGKVFADADTRALELILACIETLALNDAATDAIARDASRSSERTIRAAGRRLREISRSTTSQLARRHDGLTSREIQVLSLMADGLGNADIAARLFVTVATVKTHVNHIFTKLGVASRVEAVLAYQRDLTPSR